MDVPVPIKFVTLNLRGGGDTTGEEPKFKLLGLARFLDEHQIDVAFLQEVKVGLLTNNSELCKSVSETGTTVRDVLARYHQTCGTDKQTIQYKRQPATTEDMQTTLVTLIHKGPLLPENREPEINEAVLTASTYKKTKIEYTSTAKFLRLLKQGRFYNFHNGSAACVLLDEFMKAHNILPHLSVLAGDFNRVIEPEDHNSYDRDFPRLRKFLNRACFVDVVHPHTLKKEYWTRNEGRNDRIYIGNPAAPKGERRMHVLSVETLKFVDEIDNKLSDHKAVICTVIESTEPQQQCDTNENEYCESHKRPYAECPKEPRGAANKCNVVNEPCGIYLTKCSGCSLNNVHVTNPRACKNRNYITGPGKCKKCSPNPEGASAQASDGPHQREQRVASDAAPPTAATPTTIQESIKFLEQAIDQKLENACKAAPQKQLSIADDLQPYVDDIESLLQNLKDKLEELRRRAKGDDSSNTTGTDRDRDD